MADKKISELDALTGAAVATDDQLVIVDTSAGLTKSITMDEFKNALDTATGFVRITGDTMTGDLNFGDNDKAIFGAGSDLSIYHDGSRSIIQDNGTGNLRIQANNLELNNADNSENYLFAANNGAVTLYYDNAAKLATTSTGIDVTGTVTADDHVYIEGNAARLSFGENDTTDLNTRLSLQSSSFRVETVNDSFASALNRITVDNATGDISFYDGSGNAKFFWDASAERLGIGTTSPSAMLDVAGDAEFEGGKIVINEVTGADAYSEIRKTNTGSNFAISSPESIYMLIDSNNDQTNRSFNVGHNSTGPSGSSTLFTVQESGNVGIGTSSPSYNLDVNRGSNGISARFGNGTNYLYTYSDASGNYLTSDTSVNTAIFMSPTSSGVISLLTANTERMRISSDGSCRWTPDGSNPDMTLDASGNLLVGKTSQSVDTVGGEILSSGIGQFTVDGNFAARFTRQTSDGDIVVFRKGTGTVGSIGNSGGSMYISAASTGGLKYTYLNGTNAVTQPCNTAGTTTDGTHDLGTSGARFRDLYLSGGVYLGGTGSANKLDDYEEGVSNPTLTASVSGTKGGYGTYAKVGSLVLYQFTFNAIGSGLSGSLTFQVPFTNQASNNTGQIYFPVQIYRGDWPSDAKAFYGYLNYNSTTASLHWSRDDLVSTAVQGSDLDATDCYVRGTIMYRTDS